MSDPRNRRSQQSRIVPKKPGIDRHLTYPVPLPQLLLAFCIASNVDAADTLEPFGPGFSDAELYVGIEGVRLEKGARATFGTAVVGYGITERFSGFLGIAAQGNDALVSTGGALNMGLFATIINQKHFEVDLYGAIESGVAGDPMTLTPGTELNIDMVPDRQTAGLYVRMEFPLSGRPLSDAAPAEFSDAPITATLDATLGAYWTLMGRHQLLLEHTTQYDISQHSYNGGWHTQNVGSTAIGLNIPLTPNLELINHVAFWRIGASETGGGLDVGCYTGIIATLPSGT